MLYLCELPLYVWKTFHGVACLLSLSVFHFLEISSIDKSNFRFQARSLVYILHGFYWLPFAMKTFFWGHHSFSPFESICILWSNIFCKTQNTLLMKGLQLKQTSTSIFLLMYNLSTPALGLCIPFIVNIFLVFMSSFSISDFSHGKTPKYNVCHNWSY